GRPSATPATPVVSLCHLDSPRTSSGGSEPRPDQARRRAIRRPATHRLPVPAGRTTLRSFALPRSRRTGWVTTEWRSWEREATERSFRRSIVIERPMVAGGTSSPTIAGACAETFESQLPENYLTPSERRIARPKRQTRCLGRVAGRDGLP